MNVSITIIDLQIVSAPAPESWCRLIRVARSLTQSYDSRKLGPTGFRKCVIFQCHITHSGFISHRWFRFIQHTFIEHFYENLWRHVHEIDFNNHINLTFDILYCHTPSLDRYDLMSGLPWPSFEVMQTERISRDCDAVVGTLPLCSSSLHLEARREQKIPEYALNTSTIRREIEIMSNLTKTFDIGRQRKEKIESSRVVANLVNCRQRRRTLLIQTDDVALSINAEFFR